MDIKTRTINPLQPAPDAASRHGLRPHANSSGDSVSAYKDATAAPDLPDIRRRLLFSQIAEIGLFIQVIDPVAREVIRELHYSDVSVTGLVVDTRA